MTSPFTPIVPNTGGGNEDLFEPKKVQGSLLIVRVFDVPDHVITKFRPDGLVHFKKDGEEKTFPNTTVRAAIADVENNKVWPCVMIHAGGLVKEMKTWVDQGPKLLVWNQDDPSQQNSPYRIMDMSAKPLFVKQAMAWLAENPGFMELPAPDVWDPAAQKKPDEVNNNGAAGYSADPWAADTSNQHRSGDGSFLASVNAQGRPQDEEPPF